MKSTGPRTHDTQKAQKSTGGGAGQKRKRAYDARARRAYAYDSTDNSDDDDDDDDNDEGSDDDNENDDKQKKGSGDSSPRRLRNADARTDASLRKKKKEKKAAAKAAKAAKRPKPRPHIAQPIFNCKTVHYTSIKGGSAAEADAAAECRITKASTRRRSAVNVKQEVVGDDSENKESDMTSTAAVEFILRIASTEVRSSGTAFPSSKTWRTQCWR
jgi:hypothetical protein